MRTLLILVIVLALALIAIDVGSRIAIQHQLEQRIDSYAPGATAKVTIHGFPFLYQLAVDGKVAKITAHVTNVSQGPFLLDRVDVAVTGVRVDRGLFLHQRQLKIVAIDKGTVTADMAQADFDRLVGVPVTLGNGTAQATVAGVTVTGQVSVSGGRLVLSVPGMPVSVPIPTLPALPCLTDVRVVPGHLIGTCTFHQIPTDLQIALS